MSYDFGIPPAPRRTPLTAEEKIRAEAAFSDLVTEHLATSGRFRITADTPEMIEVFQSAARTAGDKLHRPVVSYANGRDIVITFAEE
ncbi:hypothetical protein [Nonomuraea aridisoli]|uniref:Uncharacterized protein n=1 Tax=Nonomuraea aridisoli TaxID=2070368 RepID=A0A2W2E5P2_9ACTN|nr:hypothetical protein [Nonomuraea aridisoli]PZG17641.1 hypothetical protein C1J01_17380 [Nonomuraea aridisoli]